MPGWGWFLLGAGTGLAGFYAWFVWYFQDVMR